jgi:hypothetical protein
MSTLDINLDHPALTDAATYEQVADFLRTDTQAVANEVRCGRLKANVPDGRVLPEDLVAWLAQAAAAPAEGKPVNVQAMAVLFRASLVR